MKNTTSDEAFKKAFWEREKQRQGGDFSDDFAAGWNACMEHVKSGQEPVAWIDAARFEELKAHNLMTTLTKHKAFEDDVALFAHPAPAQPVRLSEDEIEQLRVATFSTNNPFCPCDRKTMRKAATAVMDAMLAKGAAQSETGILVMAQSAVVQQFSFPRDSTGGWTIDPAFLKQIEDAIFEIDNSGEWVPGLEEMESVLLAVEKLQKEAALKAAKGE